MTRQGAPQGALSDSSSKSSPVQRTAPLGHRRDDALPEIVRTLRVLPMIELEDTLDLGTSALAYARTGWKVFPLRPRTKIPYPRTHGVKDATDDLNQVVAWWTARPDANIGLSIPSEMFVLDVDDRNGGDRSLAALVAEHGPLAPTRTVSSGGGGGFHHYYRAPGVPLTAVNLPRGCDLKTVGGYMVAPPSRVRSTYLWASDLPVASAPRWLLDLIVRKPEPAAPRPVATIRRHSSDAETPAAWFDRTTTWTEVLVGWSCVAGDGNSDGTTFRHPTATSASSATVRHGCLFVYSPNAGLDVTGAGDPHGYTRFRAWCVLNGLSLSDGARQVRTRMRGAA